MKMSLKVSADSSTISFKSCFLEIFLKGIQDRLIRRSQDKTQFEFRSNFEKRNRFLDIDYTDRYS